MEYSRYSNNNNALQKNRLGDKLYSKVWLYILRGFCVLVLFAICAVAGLGLGAFNGLTKGIPDINYAALGIDAYSTTLFDRNGTQISQLSTAENRIHIDVEDMPQDMLDALVAIEDERFYQHNGIDLEGILRSVFVIATSGDETAQGGSTITQQVIKMLVLSPSQNIRRKVQEWVLALELESQLTEQYGKETAKRMIIEVYLNYNFLGNTCYGIGTASRFYFDKEATDLTLSECAMLAGIFQAPSSYDPIENYENSCRIRQVTVLQKMLELGYITQEEYDIAYNDPVFDRVQANYQQYEEEADSRINSYFVDSAINSIVKDMQKQLGYTSDEAFNTLYYGGLSVYLTQDLGIQAIMDHYLSSESGLLERTTWYQLDYYLSVFDRKDSDIQYHYHTVGLYRTEQQAKDAAEAYRLKYVNSDARYGYDYLDRMEITKEPQYAMTIIDFHNGQIVGMTGGRADEKTVNMATNRASDVVRQPGSAFKTIAAYSYAIENGEGPASTVDDVPFYYWNWAPTNWWSQDVYYGNLTYRSALCRSANICAATVNVTHGVDENFYMALNYGFTTLRSAEELGDASDQVGSLALGSCSVSNLELTAAYSAIANCGVYIEPVYYSRILDKDGNILIEPVQESHRVIKETTAWLITDILRENVLGMNGGTAGYFRFNADMATAGKTGTSEEEADLVFQGFTNYYCAGIWTGYDYYVYNNTKSNTISYTHRALWKNIMGDIHKDLPVISSFTKPAGIVTARACTISGLVPTNLCSAAGCVHSDFFEKDSVPTERCSMHVARTVCLESGLYPSEWCTNVGSRVRVLRPDIDNIYAALDYFTENVGEDTLYRYKTRSSFNYAYIADWTMNAPECFREVVINPNTLAVTYCRTTHYTWVDLGLNNSAGGVDADGNPIPAHSVDLVTSYTVDPSLGNIVIEVDNTHVCPVCYLRYLASLSGGGGGGEESGEESGEEGSGIQQHGR